MASLLLLPPARAPAVVASANSSAFKFVFLDEMGDDERLRLRTAARERENAARRVREQLARMDKARAERASARVAAAAAKHAAKHAKQERRQATVASHAAIKQLKKAIRANRTDEVKRQNYARRAAEARQKQAAARVEAARAKLNRQAARSQRLALVERDRNEAKRLRKWCNGLTICDASCATSRSRWRDKCLQAETCCACAECALNSTANTALGRMARRESGGRRNGTSARRREGITPRHRGNKRRRHSRGGDGR